MHIVNKVLSKFGLQLTRIYEKSETIDEEFQRNYQLGLELAKNNDRGFLVNEVYRYNAGLHPKNQKDLEDIKPEYIKGLKVHYVNNVDDVINVALLKTKVINEIKFTPTKAESKK